MSLSTIVEDKEMLGSARGSARENRSDTNQFANITSRGNLSARSSARSVPATDRSEVPDSGRTNMSTARMHTAIAALAAEKHALEARLNLIEAALADGPKKRTTKKTFASRK